jgi:23S rRNA-/tRNA-specific pseudouridylate synthase
MEDNTGELLGKKMKFDQKKDGSCEIIFSDDEINVINKYKKLHLTQEFLRHFSNKLVNICIEFNKNFDEETKKKITFEDSKIIATKPKQEG